MAGDPETPRGPDLQPITKRPPIDLVPDSMPMADFNESAKHLFLMWRNFHYQNVDCGVLRRIGKTTVLKRMMVEYLKLYPEYTVALMAHSLDMARECYREIYGKIVAVSPKYWESKLRGIDKVLLFSDEVKGAEVLSERFPNIRYVAGFYSSYPDMKSFSELSGSGSVTAKELESMKSRKKSKK
jgi:hypothetical protein